MSLQRRQLESLLLSLLRQHPRATRMVTNRHRKKQPQGDSHLNQLRRLPRAMRLPVSLWESQGPAFYLSLSRRLSIPIAGPKRLRPSQPLVFYPSQSRLLARAIGSLKKALQSPSQDSHQSPLRRSPKAIAAARRPPPIHLRPNQPPPSRLIRQ